MNDTVGGGGNFVFHLHSLENDYGLTDFYRRTFGNFDGKHSARHRSRNLNSVTDRSFYGNR